ncbi:uncharacterized protein TNCV_203311 [Trichonephila clavipes]|nr:uncharacterized protein TNCV_203311 [Trichonephila clavipes]
MMIPEPDICEDTVIRSSTKREKVETYVIYFSVFITLFLLVISVIFKFVKPKFPSLAPLLSYGGFGILVLCIICLLSISYYNRKYDDEQSLISSDVTQIEVGQIV